MNKVKILHCADLHFDTPFKELNKEISQVSKEELLQVFKNIIDLTINENVEVLLIAGDVFDNLTVNKNTLFFISNQMKRIENVKVFISPGNHDPYNEKSFYKTKLYRRMRRLSALHPKKKLCTMGLHSIDCIK